MEKDLNMHVIYYVKLCQYGEGFEYAWRWRHQANNRLIYIASI